MKNETKILDELNEFINNGWCVGDISSEALTQWDNMYSRRLNNIKSQENFKLRKKGLLGQ